MWTPAIFILSVCGKACRGRLSALCRDAGNAAAGQAENAGEELEMEQTFRVGVITSTHGIHGEVKVFPTTDDAKRFKKLKDVLLDTGREMRPMEVEHVKFFKNMVIVKFKGFDDINDVEIFKGKDLYVTRENAVELGPDENFIADLIGLSVVTDEGERLGELTDVLQTGANDVYVVKTDSGKEVLLPAIRQCILDTDLDAGKITVHVLDGLLDL